MARVERGVWLGALLLACAPSPGVKPAPVSVSAPASATSEPNVEPELPAPPQLALPGEVACRFENTVAYSASDDPLRLCVGANGPCFIENARPLAHLKISISIGAGSDPPALVELNNEGFVLRGLTRAKDIQLFVREPELVAEYVVPNTVSIEAGRSDALVVGVDVAPIESRAAVRATLSCSKLTLYGAHPSYEERLEAAGLTGKPTWRKLVGKRVPLSAQPGGAKVADLVSEPTVDAFESRSGFTRIALGADSGSLVVGWVPSRALRQPPPAKIGYGSSGGGETYLVKPETDLPYRCSHDVELTIAVARARYRVGQIAAGSPFRILERIDRQYVAVALPRRIVEKADTKNDRHTDQVLQLLPGATLMVEQSRIRDCRD